MKKKYGYIQESNRKLSPFFRPWLVMRKHLVFATFIAERHITSGINANEWNGFKQGKMILILCKNYNKKTQRNQVEQRRWTMYLNNSIINRYASWGCFSNHPLLECLIFCEDIKSKSLRLRVNEFNAVFNLL